MRRARSGERGAGPLQATEPLTTRVFFPDSSMVVGYRHRARREVFPGQVLWVHVTADERDIDEFALSSVWRHAGSGSAGRRVPNALLPCPRDHAEKSIMEMWCPTCRVFGGVDTGGARSSEAEQRGYRGHLRFSDATPVGGAPNLERYWLAPLGRPRPGAGQSYLDNNPRRFVTVPRQGDEQPIGEWGSRADKQELRPLRGRKQYWLTRRHRDRPLFRVTDGPFDGEMAGEGEAVAAGSRFSFSVRFANLDLAELGGLLAALNPALVLHGGEIGLAVGGGRPFGFGSCTARIAVLEVHNALSWYVGETPPEVTVEDAVAAFVDAVDPGVRGTWPALATALSLDHVPPEHVWYPPENAIPSGPLSTDDLAAGFAFWKETRGYAVKNRTMSLIPLPDILAKDQHLPVIGKASEGRNGRQHDRPRGKQRKRH